MVYSAWHRVGAAGLRSATALSDIAQRLEGWRGDSRGCGVSLCHLLSRAAHFTCNGGHAQFTDGGLSPTALAPQAGAAGVRGSRSDASETPPRSIVPLPVRLRRLRPPCARLASSLGVGVGATSLGETEVRPPNPVRDGKPRRDGNQQRDEVLVVRVRAERPALVSASGPARTHRTVEVGRGEGEGADGEGGERAGAGVQLRRGEHECVVPRVRWRF